MVKQRKRPLGADPCLDRGARRVRARLGSHGAGSAWRSPAISGVSRRRRRRTPNSSSACAPAASTACGSRSPWSSIQPTRARRCQLRQRRHARLGCRRGGAQRAALRLRRPALGGHPGRVSLAVPPARPRPCRSRPAPSAPPGPTSSSWSSVATAPAAPSGRPIPACRQRPIRTWQIWNEENFKYFVVRPSPSDYGKLINVSYAAIKSVDPGAKLILGGMFARPKEAEYKAQAAAGLLRHRLPRSALQLDARDQEEVQRRRPAPVHDQVPAADARHRRIPHRAQSQPRCRQEALDHRDRLELGTALGGRLASPKARRARRRS